jgi:hypothetical protein
MYNLFHILQSKWKHEKTCKYITDELEIEKIKLENIKADIENKKIDILKLKEEKEIMKIKLKLEKSKNLDNKTFKAINKILMERSYNKKNINTQNINTQNNIQNNIQNNVTNNINIIGFGQENIQETLSDKDKRKIINSGYCCLEKIVEICNLGTRLFSNSKGIRKEGLLRPLDGNYDQFKNLIITNLKDNFVYKYDEKEGYFVTANKTESMNELINNRINDIGTIYDEVEGKFPSKKIDIDMKEKVKDLIEKINDENTPIIDENINKKYNNYKELKKDRLIILLYNNQDKITKDITLLLNK